MVTGKYKTPPEIREHLNGYWQVQDTTRKQGAPKWTLVSTRHYQKAGSTYMDTGKYNAPAPPESEAAPTWTLVSTAMHPLKAVSTYMDTGKYNAPPESREHLKEHW